MATLTQWTLPLNPPNPYPFYLQYLTQEQDGKLYYTKYILDIIGELNLRTKRLPNFVREWAIPPALFGGNPGGDANGIIIRRVKPRLAVTVWFALESAHRLVQLNPTTGLFTAFGGNQFPIRYPRHLMVQGPNLWYTGSGTQGALVGVLRPNRRAAYWDLPIELLTPEGLWVEADGAGVWFTPINSNMFYTGAFLARLEPSTNRLTYWSYPPPGKRPVNAGVVGEPPTNPVNIWFTYYNPGPSSRVFRLHRPSGTFFEYPPTFSAPRKIVLDGAGNAWISDWSGKISTIAKDADCGTINFASRTMTVKPVEMDVQTWQARAAPTISPVTMTQGPVTPVRSGCYVDFPLPHPLMSHGIQLNVYSGQPNLYFSQGSGIIIGRLTP